MDAKSNKIVKNPKTKQKLLNYQEKRYFYCTLGINRSKQKLKITLASFQIFFVLNSVFSKMTRFSSYDQFISTSPTHAFKLT